MARLVLSRGGVERLFGGGGAIDIVVLVYDACSECSLADPTLGVEVRRLRTGSRVDRPGVGHALYNDVVALPIVTLPAEDHSAHSAKQDGHDDDKRDHGG